MSLDNKSRKLCYANIALLIVNAILVLAVLFYSQQTQQRLIQHNKIVQLYQELNLLDWRLYQTLSAVSSAAELKPNVVYHLEDQKDALFKRFDKLNVAKYERKFLDQAQAILAKLFNLLETNNSALIGEGTVAERSSLFAALNTHVNEAFELSLARFDTATNKSKFYFNLQLFLLMGGLLFQGLLLYYTFYLVWQRKVIRPLSILSRDVLAALETNNEFNLPHANGNEIEALSAAVHALKKVLFELHQARESIKRSERESKALYELSKSGLLFVRDGIIIKSNAAMDEKLGYKKGELPGKGIDVACKPEAGGAVESLTDFIKAHLSAHPIAIEHQTLCKNDGSPIESHLTVIVLNPTDLSQGYILVAS